jgi:purine-binding chemotaxis protein CheW
MTDASGTLAHAVGQLRRAFDDSFAAPPQHAAAEHEPFLTIRIAGDPYAIRVLELAGIVRKKAITAVPSPVPELLGLAGIRSNLVPVYSLAVLLGYQAGHDGRAGWLALSGTDHPLGLAFDELEGCVRVDRAEIYALAEGQAQREHVREVIRAGALPRGVIRIPALLESINRRAGQDGRPKER